MSEKSCFVIAPIGQPETETRRRSDAVLRHIIAPIVHECGYGQPVRADHMPEPGVITSQVIKRIFEDTLVIADLSEHNPNVFYELALRHAIRKPLVQMIRNSDQIPFDVGMMRTIRYNLLDLDEVEKTKTELRSQIQHLDQNPADVESPVSQTIKIEAIKASEKPGERLARMGNGWLVPSVLEFIGYPSKLIETMTHLAIVPLDNEFKLEFWFNPSDHNEAFEEAIRIARSSWPSKNIRQAYVLRREDTKVPQFLHMRLRRIEPDAQTQELEGSSPLGSSAF